MQRNHRWSGERPVALLYSPSITADDSILVFISDRDSRIAKASDPAAIVNRYALERASGRGRRLTDNEDGYLRSYVYFEGLLYRGLRLASSCLHAASGDVYYLQGRAIRCVNAYSGTRRTLAELLDDQLTGFTHVSDDNTRLCIPTIHESAFVDIHAIDTTVQRLGLSSYLRIVDAATGVQVADLPIARSWVTHVQFRPGSNSEILYNHEWPADCGVRRLWLWDGMQSRALRDVGRDPDGSVRSRADWVCHEVWTRKGAWILYHGTYGDHNAGRSFVGRVRPDEESERVEVPFAPHYRRYWHFVPGETVSVW